MNTVATSADRYFELIEATLRRAVVGRVQSDDGVGTQGSFQLERLVPIVAGRFESSVKVDSRAARDFVSADRVIDRAGHARPVYAALAVRALADEAATDAFVRANRDGVIAFASGRIPIEASNGQAVIAAVFAAWAMISGSTIDDALRSASIEALRRLARGQQPDGTFLARNDADAPEPRWYDELALVHALSCYASASGDEEVNAAVARAVRYHAAETQPDHASNHPWAIAAFLSEPDAIPLADMMLHAAGVQSPTTMDAVGVLLLADALDARPIASR